ncbi:protein Ycf2-like [Pyrus communis]|uniref:protein Ycf2-like n=1 Tax=Pyrus communis TaxID=23211 RepID=UPI0035C0EF29
MAENAGEETSPDDQSNAASDAEQDHDQTDGTGEENDLELSRGEVQRVKKSDGNVILGSDKEVISAPESESGSDLYTKEGKGCEVSVEESRRVKKGDQNVIPGSEEEVISAPESESRSDFYTKEEKGCEVSVEEAQRVKRGVETVIPASDKEVISTPKESQSTGSQQTKKPWNFSWEISDPFSDVDPRLYQKYFEEIPDDSSYFRW